MVVTVKTTGAIRWLVCYLGRCCTVTQSSNALNCKLAPALCCKPLPITFNVRSTWTCFENRSCNQLLEQE